MKLFYALLAGFLSIAPLSFANADEPLLAQNTPKEKDKKKPKNPPTPTPTPTPVSVPNPLPVPTPIKADSPPQSSGGGKMTLSWGTEAEEEEDKKAEKPPAPGTVRITWSAPPPQPESPGILGVVSLKSSRLNKAVHKLPFLRKKDASKSVGKPDTKLKLKGRSKK